MKRIRIWCFLLLAITLAVHCEAQSFAWSLPPTSYSDIRQIGKQMYQVIDANGKTGVVKPNGTVIVEPSCDEITPFYRGWALLLQHEGKRNRVIGCLSEDGKCHMFPNTYYTLAGIEFYSDGMLAVENGNNKKVYIDYVGNECIGSKQKYQRIMPFSEGYAVVFKNENTSTLIDKRGNEPRITLPVNGIRLSHATSVYKGVALVWDDKGNYFYFNTQNKEASRANISTKNAQTDYLFRVSDEGKNVPYDKPYQGTEDTGFERIEKDGKYGYTAPGGVNKLPCQFTAASPFTDGYALVKTENDRYGILKYDQAANSDIAIRPIQSTIKYSPGETVTCEFKVTIPNSWSEHDVNVDVKNINRVSNDGDGEYSFQYKPAGQQSHDFMVIVSSYGLKLSTSTLRYSFVQKEGQSEPKQTDKKVEKKKEEVKKKVNVDKKSNDDKKKELEKKRKEEEKKRKEELKRQKELEKKKKAEADKKKKEEEKKKKEEEKKNKKKPIRL